MSCSTILKSETYTFEWNNITKSETEVGNFTSDPFYVFNFTESIWKMRYITTGVSDLNPGNAMFCLEYQNGARLTASGKLFIPRKDGRLEERFLPEKPFCKSSVWDEGLRSSELLHPVNIRCELSIVTDNSLFINKRIKDCIVVANDFRSLLTSKINSDVLIITRDNMELPAHKLVLLARSQLLSAEFQSNMTENLQVNIEIADMDGCDVEQMLEYLYVGKMRKCSVSVSMNLFVAGDKYKIKGLQNACSLYLREHMTKENAVKILNFADLHRDYCLKKSAFNFISRNAKEILSTPEWKIMFRDKCHLVYGLILQMSKGM